MGVWIETLFAALYYTVTIVTPCVGVWIETQGVKDAPTFITVTPCVGVWIETPDLFKAVDDCQSHPAWVCGLKQYRHH